jgi:hypothetical protein
MMSISERKINHVAVNVQVTVYQERRALALSLNDTKTAVKKLHRIMDVILLVTCLVIFSLVLGVANRSILVFLSSQVLFMAFFFSPSSSLLILHIHHILSSRFR